MKKRLLIIYATYGTGHKAIANYIDDYFKDTGEYEILKIDILEYSRKYLGKFTDKFYNTVMYYFPFVWELIYRFTDNRIAGPVSAKLQSQVVSNKKLKKIVLDFNPDIVIATHFTGATYISKLKKSGELNTHLVSIVTYYKAHQIWLDSYKSEDALIVNSNEEKHTLVKRGINPKIIKTFGIPVSSKYTMSLYDKSKLMKKLGFTGERPIILFYGGGGNGSTAVLPYLLTLIESKVDADVVFVCGRSQELKTKAEGIVKRHGVKNIRVLGFITNGPEYMTIADFVITKPGGITVTECLCFKKPMVLIKSAGGQEKDNYRYLTKKGYAINAARLFKFRRTIKKLCTNPKILDNMYKNLEELNKEESMKNLYDLVEDILNEK
jgi:processive 1,2-diacylglycerol beta-glucosyltransferase